MNNKKKLLIVNGAQFGHSTGHYFYCKYLSEDFAITYVCFDRGLNKLVLDGVNVCYVSFDGNKLKRTLRLLKESIRESYKVKPHLLFITYFRSCFILAQFCRSKKSVLDIRTGSLNKNVLIRTIDNYIILLQSVFFSRSIILSESLRKKLHISRKKSGVIPLGSEILFEGNHIFNSLDLLYIGALNDRNITETIKGLQLFLLKDEYKDIKISYTVVGFGREDEEFKIMASISEKNMVNIVEFVGRKNYEELNPYFGKSNVGVAFVPQTPWYDCQPVTKLFEYLLSGMPVIATNTFENKLIVNETNGILINDSPEEFCKGLISIYNRRYSYSSSVIRRSAEAYTWENIVNTNLKPLLLRLLQ